MRSPAPLNRSPKDAPASNRVERPQLTLSGLQSGPVTAPSEVAADTLFETRRAAVNEMGISGI